MFDKLNELQAQVPSIQPGFHFTNYGKGHTNEHPDGQYKLTLYPIQEFFGEKPEEAINKGCEFLQALIDANESQSETQEE